MFTPTEEKARQAVLEADRPLTTEDIQWAVYGSAPTSPNWKHWINRLMRSVCLKSKLNGPEITRPTRLGRSNEAKYERAK